MFTLLPLSRTLPAKIASIVTCCALVWCLCAYTAGEQAHAASSPSDALATIQQAIDTSDYALFSSVVDVDTLLTTTVNEGLASVTKRLAEDNKNSNDLTMTLILAAIGDGTGGEGSAINSMVVGECTIFLQAAINGGYLAGKPDPARAGNTGLFGAALKGLGKSRKQLIPGNVISNDNGTALVAATYYDRKAGDFPLRLRLQEEQGQWRVKTIDNLRELIDMSTFQLQ